LFFSVTKVRWLLTLSCILGACAPDASYESEPVGLDDYDPEPVAREVSRNGEVKVRIVAGNISSGNQQAYLDHGIRILRGLHPDITLLQEFNYGANSTTALRSFVDQAFGPEFVYYREPGSAQIPNGVISRYPILEAGNFKDTQVSNRSFAWARIDVPGSTDLVAISVHLLTANATVRDVEAQQLVNNIHMFPGDYVVLGGDFNTKERTEPALGTLSQVLVTSGPFPVDLAGADGTNASRSKPYDWVLGNSSLVAHEVPVLIGQNSFPHGFVADTRVYQPIADLAPALSSDSGATNMQHMAVVRDFALPGDSPAHAVTVVSPNGGETWVADSTHEIVWTSEGVDDVTVEWSPDGIHWTVVASSADGPSGRIGWTVPSQATSAAQIRISGVDVSASDVSDTPFNITIPEDPEEPEEPEPTGARVIINEVLINETGSNVDGEFVELVNIGDVEADLSGWKISDSREVRHTFPSGTKLAPGKAIVVFGDSAGIPAGTPNAFGASTHTLALSNSGDTVTVANGSTVVDRVAFASSLGSSDGVSANRSPDLSSSGGFLLHDKVATGRKSSPGQRASGTSF
jgi:endonuclease/exonuclease/phosphatase family metal-dependent hydrolase